MQRKLCAIGGGGGAVSGGGEGVGAVSHNRGKTQSPWPDYRANFLWPTRRMRDVRRGRELAKGGGGSKRKHCNGE